MSKYKKQKDGRYKTAVSTGRYTEDGKPIRIYVSAYSIRELEEKIALARTDVLEGKCIFDKTTTFGNYARKWLSVYKSNRGTATVAMYDNVIRKHCTDMAGIPLCEITRMVIQQTVNARADRPRTCEQIVLTVRQVLQSAVQEGILLKNVCEDIDLPRHVKKEKRILTKEEVWKLKHFPLPLADRAFIATLYGTGMRSAEMYALTKDDIDYEHRCIRVNKAVVYDGNEPSISYPKTNAGIRSVYVSESLVKLLREYSLTIPYPNLFGDENGQICRKHVYRHRFDSIMRRVFGETDITPHCLRHTFCTLCYESGMSLKACQAQMGHSSYRMVLDVYTHLDNERENVQEKMQDICL